MEGILLEHGLYNRDGVGNLNRPLFPALMFSILVGVILLSLGSDLGSLISSRWSRVRNTDTPFHNTLDSTLLGSGGLGSILLISANYTAWPSERPRAV